MSTPTPLTERPKARQSRHRDLRRQRRPREAQDSARPVPPCRCGVTAGKISHHWLRATTVGHDRRGIPQVHLRLPLPSSLPISPRVRSGMLSPPISLSPSTLTTVRTASTNKSFEPKRPSVATFDVCTISPIPSDAMHEVIRLLGTKNLHERAPRYLRKALWRGPSLRHQAERTDH